MTGNVESGKKSSLVNRRRFLAGVVGVAASTGVVTAGGPAGSRDPVSLDVSVFATDNVINHGLELTENVDAREIVARQLRSSIGAIVNQSEAVDEVNISVVPEAVTEVPDVADGNQTYYDWKDVLETHYSEYESDDSNLLLHADRDNTSGTAASTSCHIEDYLVCGSNNDWNEAIIYDSLDFYSPWRVNGGDPIGYYPGTYTDPDADGYFEDVNGDNIANVVDVQYLFNNVDNVGPDGYFDYNGDGRLDIVDAQKLFNEVDTIPHGSYNPMMYAASGRPFVDNMHTAVHEVGHNLGLKHNMGRSELITIGDREFLLVSPMLGSYDRRFEGEDNYFGEEIVSKNFTPKVYSFYFNQDIIDNAGEVIFDE